MGVKMAGATKGMATVNHAKELVRLQNEYHTVILEREKPGYSEHHEPSDTDLSYMSRISNLLERMQEPSLEDLQVYFGTVEIPFFGSIANALRKTHPRHEVIETIFGIPAKDTKALVKILEDAALPHPPTGFSESLVQLPQAYFASEEQRTAQLARWQGAEARAVESGEEMLGKHRRAAAAIRNSLHAYYADRESQMPELQRTTAPA